MDIDSTDRSILYVLQSHDRTDLTVSAIADRVNVSASTVSTRIQQMEEASVIRGSITDIDYEQAGLPYHLICVCSAPIDARDSLSAELLEVPPVVSTRELLTGTRNLHVEAVCPNRAAVERFIERMSEFDLTVEQTQILADQHHRALDYFDAASDYSTN